MNYPIETHKFVLTEQMPEKLLLGSYPSRMFFMTCFNQALESIFGIGANKHNLSNKFIYEIFDLFEYAIDTPPDIFEDYLSVLLSQSEDPKDAGIQSIISSSFIALNKITMSPKTFYTDECNYYDTFDDRKPLANNRPVLPFSDKIEFSLKENLHEEFYHHIKIQAKTHIKLVKSLFFQQTKAMLYKQNFSQYKILDQQDNLLLQLQKALYKSCNLEALSIKNPKQNFDQATCFKQFKYTPPKAPKVRTRRISLQGLVNLGYEHF